jgi:agmatine/peptidylarginine deiminase
MRFGPLVRTLALLAGLALALSACGRSPVGTSTHALGAGLTPELVQGRPLPAFALPWEKDRGKFKAERLTSDQFYAITVPPSKAGFRAMQEWEPMQTMLLTWETGLGSIGYTLLDSAVAALEVGRVTAIVAGATTCNNFVTALKNSGVSQATIDAKVECVQIATDAFWTIDYGPFPLIAGDGTFAFLDWMYYPGRPNDDAVPTKLGLAWGVSTYRQEFYFEGGNFQADGEGTCYTTERALENTGVSKAQLSAQFKDYANCDNLVVLKDLNPDGTGHIDMFFKLFAKDKVILGSYTTAQNADIGGNVKADLDADQTLLQGVAIPGGGSMTVHRLPMPNAGNDPQYGAIPRTYINSTLYNGLNLWPMYSVDKDIEADAAAVWEAAMPTFTHVPINSDEISLLSGAVHCVTRTIPVGPMVKWVADGVCNGGTCTPPAGGYSGDCGVNSDCFGPAWEGQCVGSCDGKACGDDGCGGSCGSCAQGQVCEAGQCVACDPACGDKVCGPSACAGVTCGTCQLGQACQAGQCVACTPACDGKACGDDGCGGSCGSCPEGHACQAGQCVLGGCGGLTYEGCCLDATTLQWCENDQVQTLDCTVDDPAGLCGWYPGDADYPLGYYCDASGTVDPNGDPTGQYPLQCGPCTPSCDGKECGSDGCGGSCGTCGAGLTCQAGACVQGGATLDQCLGMDTPSAQGCAVVASMEGCCSNEGWVIWCDGGNTYCIDCTQASPATCGWSADASFYDCAQSGADPSGQNPLSCGGGTCTPDCNGKQCGNDGCGGSCGSCGAGQSCQAGQCVQGGGTLTQCLGLDTPSATGCDVVSSMAGCCSTEGWVIWCDGGNTYCIDCTQASPASCGWLADQGFYDCGQSGADPSGANPLECSGGCQPDCNGKACDADNGCGALCGCPVGQKCEGGACVACQPACDGKNCGPDGCGGQCGTCQANQTCTNGVCVGGCTPDCAGKECGDNGCGGQCGACGLGQSCSAEFKCVGCVASCAGKVCGNDGCGGLCGQCAAGSTCSNGQCVPDCVPDCTNKACGDNGCGGQCGSCAGGFTCQAGACVEQCTPDCSGKVCGDDKCGGLCGTCGKGYDCTTAGLCQLSATEVIGGDDTLGGDDASGGDGEASGGCAVNGRGAGAGAVVLLLSVLGLAVTRRRVA